MRLKPQTYALTVVTYQRHRVFQRTTTAEAMIALLFRNRDQGRFALHGFVVMPEHLHVLLTPAPSKVWNVACNSLKGGFSFAIRAEFKGELWQAGHHEHRVRDAEDFCNQLLYIANNPARRQYADYPHVHSVFLDKLDPMPAYLRG